MYIYPLCPCLRVSQVADLALPMSTNRVPPPFPEPFAAAATANTAQYAGTPEKRPVGFAQGYAYGYPRETSLVLPPTLPVDPLRSFPVHGTSTSSAMHPSNEPRHPPVHPPAYQPTEGWVQGPTHPLSFPVPQVQGTRVAPSGPPPLNMVQGSGPTHMPVHGYPQVGNTIPSAVQVAPAPQSTYYHKQAPTMSHSISQRNTWMSSNDAHIAPESQRNQDDSNYEVDQGLQVPATHDNSMRPKGPPDGRPSGVPDSVRKTKCPKCGRLCPEIQVYCSKKCADSHRR